MKLDLFHSEDLEETIEVEEIEGTVHPDVLIKTEIDQTMMRKDKVL